MEKISKICNYKLHILFFFANNNIVESFFNNIMLYFEKYIQRLRRFL